MKKVHENKWWYLTNKVIFNSIGVNLSQNVTFLLAKLLKSYRDPWILINYQNDIRIEEVDNSISNSDLQLLKDFAKYKDIILSNPDKGEDVLLINKCEHINKIEDILTDKSKLKEVTDSCESL